MCSVVYIFQPFIGALSAAQELAIEVAIEAITCDSGIAEMVQDGLVRATARALAEAVVQTEITCHSNGGEDTQACGSTRAEVEDIARAEVLLPFVVRQCGIILDGGNPCDQPCRMQVIGSLNDVTLDVHLHHSRIHSGYLKHGDVSPGHHHFVMALCNPDIGTDTPSVPCTREGFSLYAGIRICGGRCSH